MQVKLAQPRSFCAGVVRAIDIVEKALQVFGTPVYVLHEIVHNRFVVSDLETKGAIFVEEIERIPDRSTIIFSAHGVAQARVEQAQKKQLNIIDATCPLVAKVHREVVDHASRAREVVLIGHEGHVEVTGTLGQYDTGSGGQIYLVQSVEDAQQLEVNSPENLGYVTQTTLSMFDTEEIIAALKKRFPKIQGPRKDDICYATQNRQQAVIQLSEEVELLLVVGAKNSSNTNRLREVGEKHGLDAYLIQSAADIQASWFSPEIKVGITAGASTPEHLVQGVIDRLKEMGANSVQELDAEPERVIFPLPQELREAMKSLENV